MTEVQEQEVTPEVEQTTPVVIQTPTIAVADVKFADPTPCHWSFTRNEDGTLNGTNSISNESFFGTMEEFEEILQASVG